MNPRLIPSLLAALLIGGAIHAAEPLSVAVLDFDSREESVKDMGPKLATLIGVHLSVEPDLILVERTELEKLLGEQELSLSGTVNAATAAKVGQLTGAKVLVTGRVFRADKETIVVAKIISTETSRVYGELAKGPAAASVADLSSELATKIAKVLSEKGETLVAKVRTYDERIASIKAALKGDKRPAVRVTIAEQHFGRPVIDPAAETEFGKMLGDCGFTVVDAQSKQAPDFEIVGEAFSELGLRKGNLQSCRARVEIKVRELATGKIVAMDRQTSMAVDLAEHVAAKSALQNAAADLAERTLPKLNP